jgi:hypothetical protein
VYSCDISFCMKSCFANYSTVGVMRPVIFTESSRIITV